MNSPKETRTAMLSSRVPKQTGFSCTRINYFTIERMKPTVSTIKGTKGKQHRQQKPIHTHEAFRCAGISEFSRGFMMLMYLMIVTSILIPGTHCEGWPNRPSRHIVPPPTSPRPTVPPVFDPSTATNFTVTASKTAVLSCIVHNLGNNSVSWIRHRDLHILSVGQSTYTSDDRFLVVPNPHTGDWALRLKYSRPRDSGQYDCQVSSRPPTARTFHLTVIEPQATILRAPEMHVGVGSLINLTCVVPYSPESPEYLHWYHKEQMVRGDGYRIWISTQLGRQSISQLVVKDAQPEDSGQYTCNPAHSNEHSITVHVLTGEYPAAMQGGSSIAGVPHWRKLWVLTVALMIILLTSPYQPYFYM